MEKTITASLKLPKEKSYQLEFISGCAGAIKRSRRGALASFHNKT